MNVIKFKTADQLIKEFGFLAYEWLEEIDPEILEESKNKGYKISSIEKGFQVRIANEKTGEEFVGFGEELTDALMNAMIMKEKNKSNQNGVGLPRNQNCV